VFPLPTVTSILGPNLLLSALILNALSLCFLNETGQISLPCKATNQIINFRKQKQFPKLCVFKPKTRRWNTFNIESWVTHPRHKSSDVSQGIIIISHKFIFNHVIFVTIPTIFACNVFPTGVLKHFEFK
jgi:hypothetical protein